MQMGGGRLRSNGLVLQRHEGRKLLQGLLPKSRGLIHSELMNQKCKRDIHHKACIEIEITKCGWYGIVSHEDNRSGTSDASDRPSNTKSIVVHFLNSLKG